jgi:hypothetical protein
MIVGCSNKSMEQKSPPQPINKNKYIYGYRYSLIGDFNGDGETETLTEHYFDQDSGKEVSKYLDSIDDMDRTLQIHPFSFMLSENKNIDTLIIGLGGQLSEIHFIKNEGDLNGDKTDEISYVTSYADYSSLNTCLIITYSTNNWKEIYSFPVWEWQYPELPFRESEKLVKDSAYLKMESELLNFEGLIKKIKTNTIKITYRGKQGDEETKIVELK